MRRWVRDRRGVVAMEFAIVSSALIVILIMVVEVGLMVWTRSALNAAAYATARCAALESSACPTPATYGVAMVQRWLFASAVTAQNVTVQTGVACNGAPGSYVVVTITSTNWIGSVLPAPLRRTTQTGQGCFIAAL